MVRGLLDGCNLYYTTYETKSNERSNFEVLCDWQPRNWLKDFKIAYSVEYPVCENSLYTLKQGNRSLFSLPLTAVADGN